VLAGPGLALGCESDRGRGQPGRAPPHAPISPRPRCAMFAGKPVTRRTRCPSELSCAPWPRDAFRPLFHGAPCPTADHAKRHFFVLREFRGLSITTCLLAEDQAPISIIVPISAPRCVSPAGPNPVMTQKRMPWPPAFRPRQIQRIDSRTVTGGISPPASRRRRMARAMSPTRSAATAASPAMPAQTVFRQSPSGAAISRA
jgi:hypothetical protein